MNVDVATQKDVLRPRPVTNVFVRNDTVLSDESLMSAATSDIKRISEQSVVSSQYSVVSSKYSVVSSQ